MCCREVRVLRTFAPAPNRTRAMRKLLTKYATGRRRACDVVAGSAALLAQMRGDEAAWMLGHAMRSVRPVPAVLWDHACSRVRELGNGTLALRMLAMAVADVRLNRRLTPHVPGFREALDARLRELCTQEGSQTPAIRF